MAWATSGMRRMSGGLDALGAGDDRLDPDALRAGVRLDHLAGRAGSRDRRSCTSSVGVGRLGQPAQDLAAALGLGDQQLGVVLHGLGRRLAGQLLGDDGDGGERRAELVGGGGGQRAQRREPLLARQHRLGDVERQLHARRFHGRLADVAGGERDAGDVASGRRRAGSSAAIDHRRRRRPGSGRDDERQQGRDQRRGQAAQHQHRRAAAGWPPPGSPARSASARRGWRSRRSGTPGR